MTVLAEHEQEKKQDLMVSVSALMRTAGEREVLMLAKNNGSFLSKHFLTYRSQWHLTPHDIHKVKNLG